MLICMDESGNTHKQTALGLVAIPEKEIEKINQLFTLRPYDPEEIKLLYHRKPDVNSKPREEFKYSDFRNAAKATNLAVYNEFLKEKLEGIAKLNVRGYFSIFDNLQDNNRRLERLRLEARILITMWAEANLQEALSPNLEIILDRQVFDNDEYIFQVYERRNKWFFEILSKKTVNGKVVHYGGRENVKEILERSSKTFKPLQLSDFLVGAFRESKYYNNPDFFSIVRNLTKKDLVRDTRGEYTVPKGVKVIYKEKV